MPLFIVEVLFAGIWVSKTNLPGYGVLSILRNFHQLTAFEQAEMILYAAPDPTVASRAKRGIRHVFGHFRAATIPYKLSVLP